MNNKEKLFNKLITCEKCGRNYLYKTGYKQPFYVCAGVPRSLCKTPRLREDVLIKMANELGGINNITSISALDLDLTFTLKDGSVIKKTYVEPSRKESWTQEMKAQASQIVTDYHQEIRSSSKEKDADEYKNYIQSMNNKQCLAFIRTIICGQFGFETFFNNDVYGSIKDKLMQLYDDLLKDTSLANGEGCHSSVIDLIGELCWENTKDNYFLNQLANHACDDWQMGKMIDLIEYGIRVENKKEEYNK